MQTRHITGRAARRVQPGGGNPHSGLRTHTLIDDRIEPGATSSAGIVSGRTPREQADRILATILNATGPIVLCMPGTLGPAWQSSIYETARLIAHERAGAGPITIVSIPYKNRVADAVKRAIRIGTDPSESTLALVLQGIEQYGNGRPVYLLGESQGSWVIAHDLQDPKLARVVTRVVMYAKPGIQRSPAAVGAQATGKGARSSNQILEIRHTDDIVPSLFSKIGMDVIHGYALAFRRLFATHDFEYTPHHYDAHAADGAAFLLHGIRPANTVHPSSDDR